MPQIKIEDKVKLKANVAEILTVEPTISINKLSKRCGICRATARLYRENAIKYLWGNYKFSKMFSNSFGMHFK